MIESQIPTPEQIDALLKSAGHSASSAAALICITPRNLQMAVAGKSNLSPSTWWLLQVTLSKSARAKLPRAVAP